MCTQIYMHSTRAHILYKTHKLTERLKINHKQTHSQVYTRTHTHTECLTIVCAAYLQHKTIIKSPGLFANVIDLECVVCCREIHVNIYLIVCRGCLYCPVCVCAHYSPVCMCVCGSVILPLKLQLFPSFYHELHTHTHTHTLAECSFAFSQHACVCPLFPFIQVKEPVKLEIILI